MMRRVSNVFAVVTLVGHASVSDNVHALTLAVTAGTIAGAFETAAGVCQREFRTHLSIES